MQESTTKEGGNGSIAGRARSFLDKLGVLGELIEVRDRLKRIESSLQQLTKKPPRFSEAVETRLRLRRVEKLLRVLTDDEDSFVVSKPVYPPKSESLDDHLEVLAKDPLIEAWGLERVPFENVYDLVPVLGDIPLNSAEEEYPLYYHLARITPPGDQQVVDYVNCVPLPCHEQLWRGSDGLRSRGHRRRPDRLGARATAGLHRPARSRQLPDPHVHRDGSGRDDRRPALRGRSGDARALSRRW